MKMAAKDLGHCLNLVLHIKDLHGNLALAASAALDLINHKHIDTIIGTLTLEQAAFLTHLKSPPPIISLSPAASPPPQPPPSFNQMTLPVGHQIQCIASLIAHFHWKNPISISQDPTLFLPLSRALHALDISISIEPHMTATVLRT
ncbi:glutamate receptor 2.7-like [Salvia splendens]|uniref:glutamate receptor 2.7-like n=1 Tax=Salvia splendens TaxID=180675 RepID=UPI001C25AE39|nr:glutamate receptor 2.7-like [Salvia splendens]